MAVFGTMAKRICVGIPTRLTVAKIGVDYYSTYCPMASISTCRLLGSNWNLPLVLSEIVNSGTGRQPDGAALLPEGNLSAKYAVVYTGVSGVPTRPPQLP